MRPVEDDDIPLGGGMGVDAPEEIVGGLLGGGLLEGGYARSFGVETRHDMTDHPILTRRIGPLQDDHQGLGLGRVEFGLEFAHPGEEFLLALSRIGTILVIARGRGVDLAELDLGAGGDTKFVDFHGYQVFR